MRYSEHLVIYIPTLDKISSKLGQVGVALFTTHKFQKLFLLLPHLAQYSAHINLLGID